MWNLAAQELKKVQLSSHHERKLAISNVRFKDLPSQKNKSLRKSRAHGKLLTKEEKEALLRIHEAIKNTAKSLGSSTSTLSRVLNEKDFLGMSKVLLIRVIL